MNFVFTDEQRMMARAFRELADDRRPIAEMQITGALVAEAAGGLGLSEADVILIAEEAGHANLQEPLVEYSFIAVPMLEELTYGSGPVQDVLRAAISGASRIAIQHPINPFVLGAAEADHLLLTREDQIHLVERSRARLTHIPSIDEGRRLCRVDASLSDSTLVASGTGARELLRHAFERGALFCAAQLLGVSRRMIELAVAYARERKQFGKPIGSYQAIKHALASAQVKLEFARPVVYHASACIQAAGSSLRAQIALSHAKLAATDAADLAARTAIQVHGAMGYSWEVELHRFMKRAWALAGTWGDRSFHARRVSSAVLGGHIALGPGGTFD
jgi:alkylation response protein AidB-like acyl-CoA dehydrogenase